MWVITRSINDYNQDGDYLERVFMEKPSETKLCELGYDGKHLINGGGRKDVEGVWYQLIEIEDGELYVDTDAHLMTKSFEFIVIGILSANYIPVMRCIMKRRGNRGITIAHKIADAGVIISDAEILSLTDNNGESVLDRMSRQFE